VYDHFSIGTTTDRVNLISRPLKGFRVSNGFTVAEWRPVLSEIDAVYGDSPVSDYRLLRAYRETTAVETITLHGAMGSPQDMWREARLLLRNLRCNLDYWTEQFSTTRVYIKVKLKDEANYKYALLYAVRIPDLEEPFGTAMNQRNGRAVMTDISLAVERGAWLADIPGTGTALALAAYGSYNGNDYGMTAAEASTGGNDIYVANKRNEANLTHIYKYTAVGAVWSGNTWGAGLPYRLLPAVPAAGDFVIFGINTALADSGPFCSLVFDITTAITNVTTGVWEYWNGAWVGLNTQDNTNQDGLATGVAFDTTGIRSVHWEQETDWVTGNLLAIFGGAAPNITGYWVRWRVTAVGGGPTSPFQGNRQPYSITWPWVEVDDGDVGGDLEAWLRLLLRNQSDEGTAALVLRWSQLLVGRRSVGRGVDFTAYINAADEQNPASITCTVGAAGAFANRVDSPTGRVIQCVNPAAAWTAAWTIDFTTAISPQYNGVYHAFLRVDQTSGSVGDVQFRYTVGMTSVSYFVYDTGNPASPLFTPGPPLATVDLGRMPIPGSDVLTLDDDYSIRIEIEVYGDGAADADIVDLILLPVDEWAGAIWDPIQTGASAIGRRGAGGGALPAEFLLDVDSISNPKFLIRAVRRSYTDDVIYGLFEPRVNGPATLHPRRTQRLWCFRTSSVSNLPYLGGEFEIADSVTAYTAERFDAPAEGS